MDIYMDGLLEVEPCGWMWRRRLAAPLLPRAYLPRPKVQDRILQSVLKESEIPAATYGKRDSNHSQLNNDLGKPDDPATQELYKFLDANVGRKLGKPTEKSARSWSQPSRSDIQISDVKSVFLNELAAGFDVVAHEDSEDFVGCCCVIHANLQEQSLLRVHTGFPEFLRVHFAESLKAGDAEAAFAHLTKLRSEVSQAGQFRGSVVVEHVERVIRLAVSVGSWHKILQRDSVITELTKDVVD